MNAPCDSGLTLGALAAHRPASIAVFERFRLDYCCGGARPLVQACRDAQIDPSAVLSAIDAEERLGGVGGAGGAACPVNEDWSTASMTQLADHIEQTHHRLVRDILARVEGILPRVRAAHGESDPRLHELARVFQRFAEEMRDHMVREERVLFPWLRRLDRPTELHVGPPWSVQRPISCMVHDHDDAGAALAAMRSLTDGFTPPNNACATYRSLLDMLRGLERDTHVHIHKENNILFPAGVRAEHDAAARHERGGACSVNRAMVDS